MYLFDIASSVLIVAAVGGFLFAASGIWPPLVSIESGSMDPHIQKGDLVFVMDEQRFPGTGAHGDTAVVTTHAGEKTGYQMFTEYGDVIVYEPDGSVDRTPIIHRARFWVEEGENWYEKADTSFVSTADSCSELPNCPAPNAGFITKGDANDRYDQVMGLTSPVKPEWVRGTAEVRVPILGEIRLLTGQGDAKANSGRTQKPVAVGPDRSQYESDPLTAGRSAPG
nr:S26 family signal peptidase [Halorhabdus rudnickae]